MNFFAMCIFWIATVFFGWLHMALAAPHSIFVFTEGNDEFVGTENAPVKTLARAVELAAESDEEATVIYIYPGDYPQTETITLSESIQNVHIQAVEPGVVIHGGKIIAAEHISKVSDPAILNQLIEVSARENLWAIDLAGAGITEYGQIGPRGFGHASSSADLRVTIAGEMLYPAQWPNKGQVGFAVGTVTAAGGAPRYEESWEDGGSFIYENERISRWVEEKDAWLHGFFHHGYADDMIGVESIDVEAKQITMAHAAFYGIHSGRSWNRVHGIHILAELDQPGEFFLDREQGLCFFLSPENVNPMTSVVIAPVMEEPLLALSGCQNVVLEGVLFEQTRGNAVVINEGFSNQLVGCVIRNVGGLGLSIVGNDALEPKAKGTMQHVIEDCDIYNTGTGGIAINAGNRLHLAPAGVLVRNCHIHHNNTLEKTYRPAISLSGVGNCVRNCEIHDILGAAVLFSGNDNVMERNEIYNAMTYGDDMGVCYTGRDITSFGNVVRSNYIYNCGNTVNVSSVYSIYLDDGACGTQVYGNIFRRSAKASVFLIGGGSYNQVHNNLSIDNPNFLRVGNRLAGWASHLLEKDGLFETQFREVRADQAPWSIAYPELSRYWEEDPKTPNNQMRDQLLVRCAGELRGQRAWVHGSKSVEITPLNACEDWYQLPLAQEEINSYLQEMPALEVPLLEEVGLLPSSWRDENGVHKVLYSDNTGSVQESVSWEGG